MSFFVMRDSGGPFMNNPPVIDRQDLYGTGLIFPLLYRLFKPDSLPGILRLLALALIPLLALGILAHLEGVFWYNSLNVAVPEGVAIGMSFMGDTMVWPFCIIVPAVMLVTFYSTEKTAALFDCLYSRTNLDWRKDSGEFGQARAYEQLIDILDYRKNIWSKVLKFAPVVIIVLFWGYNTLTCGFNQFFGADLYPYKTNRIAVVSAEPGNVLPAAEVVILDRKINLPKWDCDFQQRPLSCLATRIWALIYYGIPPFLLFQLINILWGMTYLLRRLKKWEESTFSKTGETALSIEPYSRDGLGGLSALPESGMAFFYNISAFSFLLVMSFLKEGADPSWHNYLILLAFIPLMLWSLLYPTILVHDSILSSKEKYLEIISNRARKTFKEAVALDQDENEIHGSHYEKINALDAIYAKIEAIPAWPYSYSALSKITVAFFLPVMTLFWDSILNSFVTKAMVFLP